MQPRWGWLLWLVLPGLTACEPEPRGPTRVAPPEMQHFETQFVRREVDSYKDDPSPATRRRMELAFASLDAKLRSMEAEAAPLSGDARAGLDAQIANLKLRRDLHWTRAQTAVAQLEPIERARPVAERSNRVVTARPYTGQPAGQPARAYRQRMRYRPVQPQENMFQRFGRFFRPF